MANINDIGDAEVLGEGSTLTPVSLNAGSTTVSVSKVAIGVQLTDEAVLSGYGDPMGQAAMQIVEAIANKVDNQMLTVLKGISSPMIFETTSTNAAIAPADISSALELFGEDIDMGEKVVLVSPRLYTKIRNTNGTWLPASEIAADRLIRGAVGEIYGCQIIVSNKLKETNDYDEEAFIVKPGALRLIMKRDTLMETDRNILNFSTVITASKHEACYLYDTSKAIRLKKKAT